MTNNTETQTPRFADMTIGAMVEARTAAANGRYYRYVKVTADRWLLLDGSRFETRYDNQQMQHTVNQYGAGYTLVVAGEEA